MNRYSSNIRAAYARQPIQYLVFDIGHPMLPNQLKNTVTAVQNILTLACSLRGGIRIPGFGLCVINKTYQRVCSIEILKGNFSKVLPALLSIENLASVSEKLSVEDFADCLNLAIHSIYEEFKAKCDTMPSSSLGNFVPQLQVTIVTAKHGFEVQECVESILNNTLTAKLKKIQVLQLLATGDSVCHSRNDIKKIANNFQNVAGLVELVCVANSEPELEDFFKIWLFDCDNDREHLTIYFPARNKIVENFSLKCDVKESIIQANSLPFGHRYQIQTDFFSLHLGGASMGKSMSNDLPVFELEAIGRIPTDGLCESLLFGTPHRVYPTQCWKMEWEDILSNNQCFIALCQSMLKSDEYLLTKMKPQFRSDQVFGYFVLMAGENSLLMKAVAPTELVLPPQEITCTEQLPKEVINKIRQTLDVLPVMQDLNPHQLPSGLYAALTRNLIHVSSATSGETAARYIHPALEMNSDKAESNKRIKKARSQTRVCEIQKSN